MDNQVTINAEKLTEHRDDFGARMGMWVFIFTELLLFTGLFLVYAVMRTKYHHEFHIASNHLDVFIGTLNTVILLISSSFVAISVTAVVKKDIRIAKIFLTLTILLGLLFLLNKYYEWYHEIYGGIFFKLGTFRSLKHGELIFFSLYFLMTGLHALHVIAGSTILTVALVKLHMGKITPTHYVLLENGALYWHMVDIVWIFLYPLLYLIT